MDVEHDVLTKLDAGDVDAAATIALRGYGAEVFGYLCAVLRDETRAGDAFSVFGENVWTSLASFERRSSLRTWLYKIAWRSAMRITRDPAVRRARPLSTSRAEAIAQEVRESTALHLRTEKKDEIRRLREELDPEEQTLLVLRIDRALEWRDIAEVLEIEEPALRKRFERVKEKLRRLARERGIDGAGGP